MLFLHKGERQTLTPGAKTADTSATLFRCLSYLAAGGKKIVVVTHQFVYDRTRVQKKLFLAALPS